MKDPKEYADLIQSYADTVNVIKLAQKEAYNQAIRNAAENAEIKCLKKSMYGKYRKWQNVKDDEEVDLFSYYHQTLVDKQSILKLLKDE